MAAKPAPPCVLRTFAPSDAAAFQTLRLQALQAHPAAFFSSPEEQADMPLDAVAQGICPSPDSWAIGAWHNDQLVATMGLQRHQPLKLAHKAEIWGVYVAPAFRGQGIAHAMLARTLSHARSMQGLQQVQLGVLSSNHGAIALYLHHGFVRFGTEPRCVYAEGRYHDEDWMLCALSPA